MTIPVLPPISFLSLLKLEASNARIRVILMLRILTKQFLQSSSKLLLCPTECHAVGFTGYLVCPSGKFFKLTPSSIILL